VEQKINQVLEVYAQYDEVCAKEFDSLHEGIQVALSEAAFQKVYGEKRYRKEFKNADDRRRADLGREYYQWLRPYYYVIGLDHPPYELNKIKSGVHFLGKNVGSAHPDLVSLLAKVEEKLSGMEPGTRALVAGAIKSAWAFQPRPLNNLRALSNHALGQAIDVDSATNPHITDPEAPHVDKVLDYLKVPYRTGQSFLKNVNMCMTSAGEVTLLYQRMKAISDALQKFLVEFLDRWKEAVDASTTPRRRVPSGLSS